MTFMLSQTRPSTGHRRATVAVSILAITVAAAACSSSGEGGSGAAGGGGSSSGGATGGTSGSAGAVSSGAGTGGAVGGGGSGGGAGSATGNTGGSATGGSSGSDATAAGTGGRASSEGGAGSGRIDGGGGAGASADSGGGAPVGPDPSTATRMMCTGSDPISCHFGGQPGNYDVTVVLGGATAGNTIVQAERMRTMLGAVPTNAGQNQRFTFTVNVRQPEGEPIQAVPAGTPGLDVYFLGNAGAAPELNAIGFAPATSPFVIYVAGDSTVCDQPSTDYGGWGQQLPQYFNYPVTVANYADSGESSASFLNSGALFGAINTRLKANDWVLIQFGHNDKTVTAADFHASMTSLVTGVKAKGALPVLVTPVARATFNGNTASAQHINSTGANLPEIIKQVGTEQNVPVLDLTARTVAWLNQLGPNGWQAYHALGTDVTHTNPAGAAVEAGFVVDLMKQANLTALVSRLR